MEPDMKCQKCGHENAEDSQFCGGCGASLSETTVNSSVGEEATGLPMVSFRPAIKLGFQNYVNFKGRSTRAELWWFILFYQLCTVASYALDWFWQSISYSLFSQNGPTVHVVLGMLGQHWHYGSVILLLVFLIPIISVGVRRLGDINKSSWWMLLGVGFLLTKSGGFILTPLLGLIILSPLIYWWIKPSQEHQPHSGQTYSSPPTTQ